MTDRNQTTDIQIGDTVKLNETYNYRAEIVIDIWDNVVTTDRGIRHITKIVKLDPTNR